MYLLPEDPYQDMLDFEERAFMGWEEPSNDAIDRSPEKSDLLYDQMEAEDYSSFDEDGMVR
jgi:hypothetical protein